MISEVVAECAVAIPAGAYADADSAHYVFLHADGPYSRSRPLGSERRLRAASGIVPLFSWDEREMAQDWNVRFDGLPDDRPLHAHEGEMPPARTASGEGIMRFVVGPVHAGIIECGRFTFSSGGETVVALDAQLGYAHRGVERALQGELAVEAASKVARICGSCSAARSYAFALALEALSDIELPPMVDLVRLIVAELERTYNHLADVAAAASAAGYGVGFAHGMALKERAMRLCRVASGHRLLFDAIAPGGLGRPMLEDRATFGIELAELQRDVKAYLKLLFANASTTSRWQCAGLLPPQTLKAFGAVGPAARAGGISTDIRALIPYGAYPLFAFTVARATSSDALARVQVKSDELLESLVLIRRALHELGAATLPPARSLELRAGVALSVVEGPRGAEFVAVHVDQHARIERIHVISASYRNWPLVARAMESNIVPDFPLVNKSFNLCYACADR